MDVGTSHIFRYLTDKTNSLGNKTTAVLILGVILLSVDYLLSFSYSYFTQNKLESIEQIEELKLKYPENTALINELNEMENELFEKKHFYTKLYNLKISFYTNSDLSSQKRYTRNIWAEIISANFAWLLVILLLPFVFFSDIKESIGKAIGSTIAAIFLLLLIIIATTALFHLIPTLGHPYVNYGINAISQIVLLITIVKLQKKKEAKSNSPFD